VRLRSDVVDDLVRIATVGNALDAEGIVGFLRVEGIAAMWRPTNQAAAASGGGWATGIVGPVDVLVLSQQAERAAELLADSNQAETS
jgi:putative signal transducing protein